MAKIANRAGGTKKNKDHWDVSGHTFDVVMPYQAESYTMRSSCDACHTGAERAKYGETAVQRQREVQVKIGEVRRAMEKKPNSVGAMKAGESVSAVLLDGSLGVHHNRKTLDLLSKALKDASAK
jgi:hypothetical protein